ncbi:MAG: FKBP-type peptidyl-prolyl cis-trans isomerase [Bacteroidales bacterium]|nr:FKBP-type peptidyl-prolyl cis-trans isomerase [Bacteroidales bacterium]
MRKTPVIAFLLIAIFLSVNLVQAQKSQKKKDKDSKDTECSQALILKTHQDTISYLIGKDIGSNMKTNDIAVTPEIMFAGLKDGLNSIDTVFTAEATEQIMAAFQQEMMAKQQKKTSEAASAVKAEGDAFLAANKTKEGVVALPSGLQYKVIKEGTGDKPKPEDIVEVHYTGTMIDGTVFDSSVERGEPIKFPLNGVIPGWTEGVQLMSPGAKYMFYIPAALAYGDKGAGPIPGGSVLIFEVELLSIEKK